MPEGLLMRRASSVALFTCKGAAPKSQWALGLVLAGLLVVGLPTRAVGADTILNSGTTTVSTGTNFGDSLYVATTGTATLNVIAGGYATNTLGFLGYDAGSVGTATVSSGTWANSGNLNVGYGGTGTLTVDGGSVTNTTGYLGYEIYSVGTATVSSGTWANSGSLYVGNTGTGTLNVTGGIVTSHQGIIGNLFGSVGTATVSSGAWSNSSDLYVGNTGTGTLNVNGGSVTNLNAYLGGNGATAVATVSSGTWANSGDIFLGSPGYHHDVPDVELNITGGLVTNVNSVFSEGTLAVATVSGGTWANSGNLSMVGHIFGRLNVTGGLVTDVNATIGVTNFVTVSSGTWANSGDLGVNGRLDVTGGLVTNVNATLDNISNVLVSGGTWASSGNLTVGDSTLTMNGGLVSVSGTLSVPAGGYPGTINLNSGGTLQIGVGGTTGVLGVDALTNNGTLIFNRSDDSTYSGIISGAGAVTKQGTGTFTISGNNTYTGATAVNGGKLLVNGQLGNTAVAVNASSLLGGSGTILGGVTVASSGTLSPGNSPGLLAVGSLSLLAGSTTLMEITGTAGSLYDQIVGTGTGSLTYGGNLDLVMSGSYADGTTFHLFSNFSSPSIGDFAAVGLDATGEYAGLTFSDSDHVGGVWTSTWTTNHQRLVFSTGTGDLVVVPEPSTYAMALAGLACGGWQMWRRRRLRQASTLAA